MDLTLAFADFHTLELGPFAGTGYADAAIGLEHGAVVAAHQLIVLVGEKAVRGKIERPALMRADIVPGPGLTFAAGKNEPQGLALMLDFNFSVLAFCDLVGRTEEH